MKNVYSFIVILLLNCNFLFSQVAINNDGSNPDGSAQLDVKSSNKGLLPPRMTRAEINAIVNPANGLLVYCTNCGSDGLGALSMYMGGAWYTLSTNCLTPITPQKATNSPSSNQIVWNWNGESGATNFKWNTSNDFATAFNMGKTTSKVETGLSCGTSYTRYVWAYSVCGNSSPVILTQSTLACLLPPTLTTVTPSNILSTSAVSGGNITGDGGSAVFARGVCWGIFENPTIADSRTSDGQGPGFYSSSITNLLPGKTYFIRAYATNSIGTSYGLQASITTLTVLPTLSTSVVSSIAANTATCGGDISSDGGSPITARGICWGTNQNPTLVNQKTSDGASIGAFTSSLTGLSPVTTYYIRAYATNSVGTAYGGQVSFLTIAGLPILTTTTPSAISANTATSGGNISSDGGASVTSRGVCWSTNQNPTVSNQKSQDGSGIGTFASAITGLTSGLTYYVRAYAITAITATTATGGGNISSDGGSPVTSRGVCWGTNSNPTLANFKTNDGTGSDTFVSSITGLLPVTTYYFRSYATNIVGTTYGNEVTIQTSAVTTPVLTTNIVSVQSTSSAISGGVISYDGGLAVTVRGICWSTTQRPTTSDSKVSVGAGIGNFAGTISSLTANTTYYLRAFATNSIGTSYGDEYKFKTFTGTVTDIDGNIYNTVTIGTQVWMVENLKTTRYKNGDLIPNITDNNAWGNLITGAYCWYDNNIANKGVYGAMYNWFAVNDIRGIAPTGWHVASYPEWTTLKQFLDGTFYGGKKIKEAGTAHWNSPNSGSTNETSFTAMPGGGHDRYGFDNLGYNGSWWTSTRYGSNDDDAWYIMMSNNSDVIFTFQNGSTIGYSVRCVKD